MGAAARWFCGVTLAGLLGCSAAVAEDAAGQPLVFEVVTETLTVEPGEIESAAVGWQHGKPVIEVVFGPDAADKLKKLTTENVGRTVNLRIADEIVSSPRVMAPIEGGRVLISGNFSAEEAEAIAAALGGAE